jgi:hypothetical protein
MMLIVYEQSVIGNCGGNTNRLKEEVSYVANGAMQTIVESEAPLMEFQND